MSSLSSWGIVPLSSSDLDEVLQHFSRLDKPSFSYRFGGTPSLESVRSFLEKLPFKGCCYGLYLDGILRAVVFMIPVAPDTVEYAISVEGCVRRRGWAKELTNYAFDIAANRGIQKVEIQFNSYNTAIKNLVAQYPVSMVERFGADTTQTVDLAKWEQDFSWHKMLGAQACEAA